MKLFKSLLLGSAAGLVAVAGASAADLGVKKPSPVEYVKVCSAHGAGFWYIPGSDVCIKLGGRVRAEYLYATPYTRGDDTSSFRATGRLEADVRQTTSYGLLRTFIRYEISSLSGRYVGASLTNLGNNAQNSLSNGILDKAFIQFYTGTSGFFTAGRSASFFDFYANSDNYTGLPGSDRGNTDLFAYTFTFGGGISATLSVEDSIGNRRMGVATASTAPTVGGVAYAGQAMPDLVGNIRIDQAWGSAQLSAALHEIRVSNRDLVGGYVDTEYGWAIQGGVKVNLPSIAAGDYLYLQAAYGDGATDFSGAARHLGAGTFGGLNGTVLAVDGYVDAVGNLKKAKAWSIVGSFVHNFTPTIQGAVYAGYGDVNYSGSVAAFNDFKTYAVGGRINWIPVRNFTIGTEVMYNYLDPKGTVASPTALYATKSKYDGITARIRFQRDF
ncbi:MAG: porin [Proteobacteria bacterium]|nr:porin [Pseudomonadota bacterium]